MCEGSINAWQSGSGWGCDPLPSKDPGLVEQILKRQKVIKLSACKSLQSSTLINRLPPFAILQPFMSLHTPPHSDNRTIFGESTYTRSALDCQTNKFPIHKSRGAAPNGSTKRMGVPSTH